LIVTQETGVEQDAFFDLGALQGSSCQRSSLRRTLRYRLNIRAFIALLGGAAEWPLAARAQLAQRVWRIGILAVSPPPSAMLNAFRDSLRERGYIEGQNMLISVRSTDSFEANPAVATELVRRRIPRRRAPVTCSRPIMRGSAILSPDCSVTGVPKMGGGPAE
jgi:hypothetical protein